MQLLADSWKLLIENRTLVMAYAVMAAIINLSQRVFNGALGAWLGTTPNITSSLADIVLRIVFAAAYAALFAIMFSRLGKELDKPLWKCKDDTEALQRFFMPWFILVLTFMMIARVHLVAIQSQIGDAGMIFMLFIMGLYVFLIPLGSCVMYWGRLNFDEIPDTFSPIARQFPLVAVALFVALLQFFWGFIFVPGLIPENAPYMNLLFLPFDLALGALDCLVFIIMWQVLRIHRDADYDNDFDL